MAKKAALLILGLIMTVSLSVGIVIGMQLSPDDETQASPGGGGGGETNDNRNTPEPTASSPNGTEAPAGTTTGDEPTTRTVPTTPGEETTTENDLISPPEREIANEIERRINQTRRDNGKVPLYTTGYPTTTLEIMATAHSQRMADERTAQISLGSNTSAERYRAAGMYDICQFPSDSTRDTITPEVGQMELVANPVRVQNIKNVEEGYDGNETDVAVTVMETWLGSRESRQKLLYDNAREVAVGVTITDDGAVYVTGSLCGAHPAL